MSRLLNRLKVKRFKKKKVSFVLSENILEDIENLRAQLNVENKSLFIEKLLEYAIEELKKELKKENRDS